ncbi:hypothetical protein ACSBR2_039375 [Camellia fascicularis]
MPVCECEIKKGVMNGIAMDSVLKELKQLINTILKDIGEKKLHEQNNEVENLVILNLSDIMEQIKPLEVKVIQPKSYKPSDGMPSMENRTMVQEEITVGFDNEALTVKEQLAGEKK